MGSAQKKSHAHILGIAPLRLSESLSIEESCGITLNPLALEGDQGIKNKQTSKN